jgi:putative SOS response-associated peptidase YedK
MCGRFTLAANKEVLEKRFGLKLKGRWEPRFNLAPEQVLPVVWNPGNPEFVRQSWGLRPAWWSHGARSLINIRVETLKTKATFKRLIAQQRCLVPADGFYEWQKSGRLSQPFRFTLKDGGLFSFPALWEKELGPGGEKRLAFALITVPPNPLAAKVHDRMPCILKPEDETAWLDPSLDSSGALSLCYAYPASRMAAVPVSRAVNSPAAEGPSLIRQAGPPLKS